MGVGKIGCGLVGCDQVGGSLIGSAWLGMDRRGSPIAGWPFWCDSVGTALFDGLVEGGLVGGSLVVDLLNRGGLDYGASLGQPCR